MVCQSPGAVRQSPGPSAGFSEVEPGVPDRMPEHLDSVVLMPELSRQRRGNGDPGCNDTRLASVPILLSGLPVVVCNIPTLRAGK